MDFPLPMSSLFAVPIIPSWKANYAFRGNFDRFWSTTKLSPIQPNLAWKIYFDQGEYQGQLIICTFLV